MFQDGIISRGRNTCYTDYRQAGLAKTEVPDRCKVPVRLTEVVWKIGK